MIKMLAIERRRTVLKKLESDGKVIVSELALEFGVTEETVRRDLERLDRDGLVSKTHGGAVSKQNGMLDLPYNVREGENVSAKKSIAKKCAELISDGESLAVDSSSTALYIIKQLKDKQGLTIITNSVKVLLELQDKSDWTVLSTGGTLKRGSLALVGSSAEKMISSYHVDTAICSCRGIDLEFGISDSNENDGLIKRAMLASADRHIIAVDSSKFDKRAFVKVCDISDADIIITEHAPEEKWTEALADKNIELVY